MPGSMSGEEKRGDGLDRLDPRTVTQRRFGIRGCSATHPTIPDALPAAAKLSADHALGARRRAPSASSGRDYTDPRHVLARDARCALPHSYRLTPGDHMMKF